MLKGPASHQTNQSGPSWVHQSLIFRLSYQREHSDFIKTSFSKGKMFQSTLVLIMQPSRRSINKTKRIFAMHSFSFQIKANNQKEYWSPMREQCIGEPTVRRQEDAATLRAKWPLGRIFETDLKGKYTESREARISCCFHHNNNHTLPSAYALLLSVAKSQIPFPPNKISKRQDWLCRQENFMGASIKSCNGTSEAHRLQGISNENWRIKTHSSAGSIINQS